jgi:HK97 family phage portal protein
VNILSWQITRATKAAGISLDTLIRRLEAVHETTSGIAVTPDTCMRAPTVHAIVTAVSRRLASLPVHVMRKTTVAGRDRKEHLGSHLVQNLLDKPNDWQTMVSHWLDATSWLLKYGNCYAFKARGTTGPIRRLEPIPPNNVIVEQDDNLNVTYRVTLSNGGQQVYTANQFHHVRGSARDGLVGDSPVHDARESIAMEIAAEQFGASFFANGAMPGIIWKYEDGFNQIRIS